MANMVTLVFSMVKCSVLKVEFILVNRVQNLILNELAFVLSPIINLTAVLFL